MKILMVSQEFPYPPHHSGAKLKLYNLLKYLSKKNEIFLISFIESKEELKYISKIKEYCSFIATVLRKPCKSLFHRIFSLFLKKYPHESSDYFSKELKTKILDVIKTFDINVVHFDLIYMAQYVNCIYDLSKVIAPNDINWLLWRDAFRLETNLIMKIKNLIHYFKVKRFEIDFYKKFDRCIVVTQKDEKEIRKYLPPLKISVIPIGVDFHYFQPDNQLSDSHRLIFTGVMSYKPNVDAMLYFCKEILPLVKDKIQDIKLYIIGRDPTREIIQLAKDEVVVTGYVEDIRPYIKEASVYVCPLRMGSGIKNKILEAMSIGIPIVATSLSVEGIEVVPGEHIIIANKPEEFAKNIIVLINDKKLRLSLRENARRLIEEKYNWEKVADEYGKIYEDIIENKMRKN